MSILRFVSPPDRRRRSMRCVGGASQASSGLDSVHTGWPVARGRRDCGPARRGFTLVELMVAITGGLFLAIVVFSLSRQGSLFYQQEMRVAAATNAAIVGFERLRSDIARAGFMSSPNIRRDHRVCGNPVGDVSWPAELKQLASLTIEAGPAMPNAIAAQVSPSQITLSGAFSSVEAFPTVAINNDGVNYNVFLEPQSAPMVRIGYSPAMSQAAQEALLGSVFGTGRALRIFQPDTGKEMYGTIVGVGASSGVGPGTQRPYIRLSLTPLLRVKGVGGSLCGLHGLEGGDLVNPVNIVRYDLRNLSGDPNYANIYAAAASNSFDKDRTELTRVELNTAGDVIAGTQELVAEYGVDLQFGLTVVDNVVGGTDPTLRTLAPGDAAVTEWAGPTPGLAANKGPELVRAVRVRLSVRSRDADRSAAITASPTVAPGLYRIGLGGSGGAPFARVRTLQADIALRNQMEVFW